MTVERTDVLIVGGGPVGVFLGALLADAGVDVRVWERRPSGPTGSRAIGIHPPSLDAFAAVGVDRAVLGQAALVRRGVGRSRGRDLGDLRFDRASDTHPYIATLDQHRTEQILRDRLATTAPGALRVGTELTSLTRSTHHVDVTGIGPDGDRRDLRAAFVVGADGARSTVRALLGVPVVRRAYPDRYVMGDFADPGSTGDADTAFVDVGAAGVVESFPLPGGRRRYVALVEQHGRQADAAELARIVRERTGARPDPASCSMFSGFRVRRSIAGRVGVGRVVLVGDAAHEISPIGGQGMNLGWLDAAELAPLLAGAVRTGDAGPWPGYARRRQAAARRAARQAEWNMALGRPAGGAALLAREALLRSALSLPTAHTLARTYAMRWA